MIPSEMSARFQPGTLVRIRDSYPIGHCRTPFYVRGLIGQIERYCGHFANPEELAYRRDGKPEIALYRVRLELRNLWPEYHGPSRDTLEVEIFEHWLEPVLSERTDQDAS